MAVSNVEKILRATIDGEEYPFDPQSRVEVLLLELKDAIEAGGGGGGGGTTNYNLLSNRPQVNGVTLTGNKTSDQLGLASASDLLDYIEPAFTIPSTPTDSQIIMWCNDTTTDYKMGGVYQYDDINTEWVTLYEPSSGNSGSLGADLTATVAVGGVEVGDTFQEGDSIESVIRAMISPVLYPTFTAPSATIVGSGSKLLEKGATLSATMTITFNRGTITPAYGTSGYRSGAATSYSLNGGTAMPVNNFTVTVTESLNTYTGTVNYDAGEQPKDSSGQDYSTPLAAGSVSTNTITYEFVNALWANTSLASTIAKQSLVSKTAKVKQFSFPDTTAANPEVFDIPSSWSVTGIEVLNTLSNQWESATDQFDTSSTTHDDAAGNPVTYTRYTCNLGMALGARKCRVKWS